MAKKFQTEREGQIKFFEDLRIDTEVELSNNTDGVYKGTLFEFKLNIPDINKVLFQSIKYLSHLRIKGVNVPKNILLISLNTEDAYLFDSENFIEEIEKIYTSSASRNNEKFDTKTKPEIIKYNNIQGLQRLIEIFNTEKFTKIHIDVFCVVGWADRFYRENPNATKIKMFDELRNPYHFKDLIYAWNGDEQDFKYIMDCLNDRMHKKELGAFYTPPAYCKKATELVRKAIFQIPKTNDYIILDRCAGTGNLEEFLTDKNVDDITIAELDKYFSNDFKLKYLKDKANIISTFYSEIDFNSITLGELEKYKTKINIHDYLFDNELSHTIVNTYELKEWIVLNERIGDKVKMIIPPPIEIKNTESVVNGGDALSKEFILGENSTLYNLSNEYFEAIKELNDYVKNPKINVLMFENPPYRDMTASDKIAGKTSEKSFIYSEFVRSGTNQATHNDIANLFIWSAWKYYLTKENDCYIIFSPIKYWKSLNLSNKNFIDGFLYNRKYFHATDSSISCILWKNIDDNAESLKLKTFDIDVLNENRLIFLQETEVKKVYHSFAEYNDKRTFPDDEEINITFEGNGMQSTRICKRKTKTNKNILAHLRVSSFNLDKMSISLTRFPLRTNLETSHGFYLRSDNYIEKLPLFCAKLYPQKNWYERDIYFTTADGGDKYTKDGEFLKSCLIYTCLSPRNHCLSFNGSDGRFYKNELCFDKNTLVSKKLKEFSLSETENDLLNTFKEILKLAKNTSNYNPEFTYGTYQIDQELNTRYKDETDTTIYDYPQLNTKIIALKSKLADYYEEFIQPNLFDYELLK